MIVLLTCVCGNREEAQWNPSLGETEFYCSQCERWMDIEERLGLPVDGIDKVQTVDDKVIVVEEK